MGRLTTFFREGVGSVPALCFPDGGEAPDNEHDANQDQSGARNHR